MTPVCVKCQRFYRPIRNGFPFIEGMPIGGSRVPPGTEAPHLWKPYKLWRGDLMECQGCGHQIVSGFARQPVAEHYMPHFGEAVEALGAKLQVNDCC